MRTVSLKLGLSLMVVLSFWAEQLPAQEIVVPPGGENIRLVPTVPYEPARVYPLPYNAGPRTPPPARQGVHYLFNKHGMGCQSNAPWGACGSFHYDMRFIFGSCRDFFGEPCYPNVHEHKQLPR